MKRIVVLVLLFVFAMFFVGCSASVPQRSTLAYRPTPAAEREAMAALEQCGSTYRARLVHTPSYTGRGWQAQCF